MELKKHPTTKPKQSMQMLEPLLKSNVSCQLISRIVLVHCRATWLSLKHYNSSLFVFTYVFKNVSVQL